VSSTGGGNGGAAGGATSPNGGAGVVGIIRLDLRPVAVVPVPPVKSASRGNNFRDRALEGTRLMDHAETTS
jgi:hypothetical protein